VRTILVMLVLFAAAPVRAQSVEQEYIAAHDRAIAALQKKWGDCQNIKDVNAMWADVVVVTTEGLLRHWLQAHKDWWKDNPLPVDPEAAFRSDTFYSMAVGMGAAFSGLAELPVDKPAGAIAAALLGTRSNGGVIWPPGRVAVAVMKGGKVHVADVELSTQFGPAAACDALKANDPALEAYGKCWERRFRNDPAFAAAKIGRAHV